MDRQKKSFSFNDEEFTTSEEGKRHFSSNSLALLKKPMLNAIWLSEFTITQADSRLQASNMAMAFFSLSSRKESGASDDSFSSSALFWLLAAFARRS